MGTLNTLSFAVDSINDRRRRMMEGHQQLDNSFHSDSSESSSNQEALNEVNSGHSMLEDQIRQSNNQIGTVILYGVPIVSLSMDNKERLCLAQISSTLLKDYSYNEIHNRRVALGITCAQCTPVQLELLRRAGAMPVTSRRCGMITRREAERLCKSFLGDHSPPKLPENFAFDVSHCCAWGCRGAFLPSRYNSSRAKCIKCFYCSLFFSPNKFIFHSHRTLPDAKYVQPDAANFNSWRRHIHLTGTPPDQVMFAWEDVKAMFNGGSRKRVVGGHPTTSHEPEPSEAATVIKVAPKSGGAKASSKRIKQEPSAKAATEGPSTSSAIALPSPMVATHQPSSLLARLNSIVPPSPIKPVDQLVVPDYGSWNASRFCWPPYSALPFHPYTYYNYLIHKSTDQLVSNAAAAAVGWPSFGKQPIHPRLQHPAATVQPVEESDEDGEYVDVESTDQSTVK